ncbi:hypothetical protein [Chryseobacterium cucumeris]|nr:hypothetical protein [Chryseobacterium cucumeris]
MLVGVCIYVTAKKGFNGITPLPLAFFLYILLLEKAGKMPARNFNPAS